MVIFAILSKGMSFTLLLLIWKNKTGQEEKTPIKIKLIPFAKKLLLKMKK